MTSLSVRALTQETDIVTPQSHVGSLPVQLQQTLVRRLQENIRKVLPKSQRSGIREHTLTQYGLRTNKVTLEHEFGSKTMREGRHGADDPVNDRRCKGPCEVSTCVGAAVQQTYPSTSSWPH